MAFARFLQSKQRCTVHQAGNKLDGETVTVVGYCFEGFVACEHNIAHYTVADELVILDPGILVPEDDSQSIYRNL